MVSKLINYSLLLYVFLTGEKIIHPVSSFFVWIFCGFEATVKMIDYGELGRMTKRWPESDFFAKSLNVSILTVSLKGEG